VILEEGAPRALTFDLSYLTEEILAPQQTKRYSFARW